MTPTTRAHAALQAQRRKFDPGVPLLDEAGKLRGFTAQPTESLARKASGFAAIINGVLDVRTVTDGRNHTAHCAFSVLGRNVHATCTDPDCDCLTKALAALHPEVRIVAVSVEVTHG